MNGTEALFTDLLLSGWIGQVGDGEMAFLLLTVDHADAPAVMPLVAAACGLNPTPDSVTERVDPDVCHVQAGADRWIRLLAGANYATSPVGAESARMMLSQRRAVLVVGFEPMPPGLGAMEYVERHGARTCLGVVEVRSGSW